MPWYVVMTSSAQMPSSCKGFYRNVAVVAVEDGAPLPKMISERAKGVERIVRRWGPVSVGTTERCAYRRALAEATALVTQLQKL